MDVGHHSCISTQCHSAFMQYFHHLRILSVLSVMPLFLSLSRKATVENVSIGTAVNPRALPLFQNSESVTVNFRSQKITVYGCMYVD